MSGWLVLAAEMVGHSPIPNPTSARWKEEGASKAFWQALLREDTGSLSITGVDRLGSGLGLGYGLMLGEKRIDGERLWRVNAVVFYVGTLGVGVE